MSTAISGLPSLINQGVFNSKEDTLQNGLFEDVMRETYTQQEISPKREISNQKNSKEEKIVSQENKDIETNELNGVESAENLQESQENVDNLTKMPFPFVDEQQSDETLKSSEDLMCVLTTEHIFKEIQKNPDDAKEMRFFFAAEQVHKQLEDPTDLNIVAMQVPVEVNNELGNLKKEKDRTVSSLDILYAEKNVDGNNLKVYNAPKPLIQENVLIKNFELSDLQKPALQNVSSDLQDQKLSQDNKSASNVKNTIEDLFQERPQSEVIKLSNQPNQSSDYRDMFFKIDTPLTTSDVSKGLTLISQSNLSNLTNEQIQSSIGLKLGNISTQNGFQQLKISILPQELGTINLNFKTISNSTEAHFTFSHQDGFNLFQDNKEALLALLGKSGLDIQHDKVSFDLLDLGDSSSQLAHQHQQDPEDLKRRSQFLAFNNEEFLPEEMRHIQSNVINSSSLLNLVV